MAKARLPTLLLLGLLAACARTPRPTVVTVHTVEAYGWAFVEGSREEPARLAYGVPNSDDVVLVIRCAAPRHPAQVLYLTGADRLRAPILQLAAAGRELRLPAFTAVSEEGVDVIARADRLAPVLDLLGAGGEARVWAGGASASLTRNGWHAAVTAFRAACPSA